MVHGMIRDITHAKKMYPIPAYTHHHLIEDEKVVILPKVV